MIGFFKISMATVPAGGGLRVKGSEKASQTRLPTAS